MPRREMRRLPSHGTLIAYVALFLALCGSGYAAARIAGAVKVTCSASSGHRHIACRVVGGAARGPRGPQGPPGPPGSSGNSGPTVVTEDPAYSFDPTNTRGYLVTPFTEQQPNRFEDYEYTTAEGSNEDSNFQNLIDMPLENEPEIGGDTERLASVQFCINISGNINPAFKGVSEVSVDKATVYESNEPNPGGAANTGTATGPPAYSAPTVLLSQNFTGETDIDSCLTASTSTPQAVSPNGFLYLVLTVGLTTGGGTPYGQNRIQFGRVTTTFTPS